MCIQWQFNKNNNKKRGHKLKGQLKEVWWEFGEKPGKREIL